MLNPESTKPIEPRKMNSELMNILVSSVVTGLIVMVVTWSIATAGAARQVEEAVDDAWKRGKDHGKIEYLASPEFARKLRDAHEAGLGNGKLKLLESYEFMSKLREARKAGATEALEEMAAKVENSYFKGVEDGTVDAEANHASDLVAARAAGYGEAVQAREVFERLFDAGTVYNEGYESGYKDGDKAGYKEGHEAAEAERDKAVLDMVDALGGTSMDAIDDSLKAMNFPNVLGVEPIRLTEEQEKALADPDKMVVIDASFGHPVVTIAKKKDVGTDVKSKPKAKPVKPVKEKAAKIPEVLRRKPAKSPLVPPKEVKAPTRVKAAKPVKKPPVGAGPDLCAPCPPCKPWEKTRRSRQP